MGTKGCPEGCNPIELEIDCSDYPANIPFPPEVKNGCATIPSQLKRTNKRTKYQEQQQWNEFEFSNKKKTKYRNLNDETMNNLKGQGYIWEGMDNNTKGIRRGVYRNGGDFQVHHILPIMLGGENKFKNYFPLSSLKHDEVHDWWSSKYKQESQQLKKSLKDCNKSNKNTKEQKQLEKCGKSITSLNEGSLAKQANCLAKKPASVKLCVKCKNK